jgi:hypothetical protein
MTSKQLEKRLDEKIDYLDLYLRENGITYDDNHGFPIARPEARMLEKAIDQKISLLRSKRPNPFDKSKLREEAINKARELINTTNEFGRALTSDEEKEFNELMEN